MAISDDYIKQLDSFEGCIPYLYLDTAKPANATTARGFLVSSVGVMQSLPWLGPDGSLAAPDAIVQEWNRVKGLPDSRKASFYCSPSGLHLSQFAMDSLTRQTISECLIDLRRDFAEFDAFPYNAQLALLDMRWNLGNSRIMAQYPKLIKAVNLQQWSNAAAECGRNVSDPAFKARNDWTTNMFLEAAKAV